MPVSELIGGRVRDRIRLYGSAGMYMPPEKYAEEAHAIARARLSRVQDAAGHGARKGSGDREIDAGRGGPGLRSHGGRAYLVANGRPQLFDGNRRASGASNSREYNIAWLEEPMPPDDHEAYRRLKELDYVPLASGEHEPTEDRYMDLILTESVDYVQMDVVCQGGYPTARRLFGAKWRGQD